MKDKLTESFLLSIEEIEPILLKEHFKKYSFVKKGYAYFIQYRRKDCEVEFIFGPPEFQIEFIVFTTKGKFSFKDLLKEPDIANWVKKNKYNQADRRDIRNEIVWFVELLKISLPIIE
ncbi:MAG: hypothetical protein GXX85_07650 [Ignavibacteria bacterium]|nr:hypothetical protein [Ignavibacteria bacterium]